MPRMPLSGVRSSWLTVARKRDLATLAASARLFASSRERTASTRSVTSLPARSQFGLPSLPAAGISTKENQRGTPSTGTSRSSTTRTPSGRCSTAPCSTTCGVSVEPIRSRGRRPSRAAKPSLAKVMRPCPSRCTTAWVVASTSTR